MRRQWYRILPFFILAASLIVLPACSFTSEKSQTASVLESATPFPSPSLTAAPSSEPEKPGAKGFLWKVEGGSHPAYLIGTIHIANKEMYPLDSSLEQVLTEADFVALELDLTKVDQKKTLELVNEKAKLPEGTALKDKVDEKDYERFQSILKKSLLAASAPMLDRYEPWYAAMTLEGLPALRFMMTDGIDQYLAKQAHKTGKKIIELESMESQLDVFDGMSEELQKLYFRQTVNNSGMAMDGMQQLIQMWTDGDLEQLESAYSQFKVEGRESMGKLFEEYYDALLSTRNDDMADKIDSYLRKGDAGTYLIAVGSLHMVGENGLVSLLEEKGYKVEFVQ